jgi:hypothetical protein
LVLSDIFCPLPFALIADVSPQHFKIERPPAPQLHRSGNFPHRGFGLDNAFVTSKDGNRIVNATTLTLRHFITTLHRAARYAHSGVQRSLIAPVIIDEVQLDRRC